MANITTRQTAGTGATVKNAPLTSAEVDGNFLAINTELASKLSSETVTSLSINANVLTYTNENGDETDIDLSLYLDDTNLARIVSGNLAADGTATFTRSDNTTFQVDFSSLVDQTASEILTSIKTVDGTGSGLDADLLDGVESGSFLRSDASDQIAGANTISYAVSSTSNFTPNDYSITNAPFAAQVWHDLFAFGRNYSVVYEQNDGTSWSTASANMGLFAQKEDQSIVLASGSGIDAIRWTFTNTSWGIGRFLAIGFTYGNPASSKTVLVESGNGSTFTQRHLSTTGANGQVIYFPLENYSGDTHLRVTITRNDTNDLRLSYMRLFTMRSGDQGQGKEYENPISWDASRNITVAGNISLSGTVDGRDVAADGTKLDGIEAGATADQTASEIRSLVESATDSNVFTDADHLKLDGIESGATADQTASEILTAIKTVDGSGSELDADTVDGLEASQFLRSDANDGTSSQITLYGTTPFLFAPTADGMSYNATENGGNANSRYFLRFDRTNNASYPYLTNRTPSGDVAVFTGGVTAGTENEIIRFKGGDGTRAIELTNSYFDMGTNDITDTKVGQWDTAYGWGDHASAGYQDGTYVDGIAYENSATLSRSVGDGQQWVKICDLGTGQPQRIYLKVTHTGDNANCEFEAEVSIAGYGFVKHIIVKNPQRYNSPRVSFIRVHQASSGDVEVWLQVEDLTSLNGNLIVRSNKAIPTLTATSTEPTWSTSETVYINDTALNYDVLPSNGILFQDNVKASFGTSADLQIYHDGSNSYIKEDGTGQLYVDTGNFYLRVNGSENAVKATANGAVSLYYDNAEKLSTSSTGVDITGRFTTTSRTWRYETDSWTYGTHDLVNGGWNASISDYIYLKAPGNSDSGHGAVLVADNGIYFGRMNQETGTGSISDSATAPMDSANYGYINSSGLTVSGSSITANGNTVWHAGNDGAGSGLDADTLDGQDASAFATSTLGTKLDDNIIYRATNTNNVAGVWETTISDVTAYTDGLTVFFYPNKINGSSTATTFEINSLGAKNIKRPGSATNNLTTHYHGSNTILLRYNSSDDCFNVHADYNSTDDYRIRWNSYATVNNSSGSGVAVHGYQLLMEGIDGKFYPVTEGGSTGNTNAVSTAEMRIGGTILYYESGTDRDANTTTPWGTLYESIASGNMEYWNNRDSGWATTYRPIYLVATINSNGNFVLDNTSYTSFLTQDLPTSDDGKYYIRIGWMQDNYDDWRLEINHPIYVYKDGMVREWGGYASNADTLDGNEATAFAKQAATVSDFSTSNLSPGKTSDLFLRSTGSSDQTVTLTSDSVPAAVRWEIGQSFDVAQYGTGKVTVVGASGVTVNGTPSLSTRAQYSVITCMKVAANEWLVFGDLETP